MRLLHFSDLHLDAQFAWAGPESTRKRRENLRSTLLRIVELARAEDVHAVLSGGDLYEHERVTPDTTEFLRSAFARLDPIPVYLAPGNHDWFGPESVYERVDWSPNVHVFREDRLRPVALADDVTLWGGAHRAPANTDDFLAGFRVDRPGIHLGLFHAAERGGLLLQETGKAPHAAFDAAEIETAGLDHAFLGHYHSPKDAVRHTYPGNPDPLTFGEEGERGAVIAEVGPDGSVARRRVRVAISDVRDLAVDVTGAASRLEVRERIALALIGVEGTVRLTVGGEVAPEVEVVPSDLDALFEGLDGHVVRFVGLRPAYDLDTLAEESTVRGQFVRDARAAGLDPDLLRRVLVTGLRALDARDDLEVV
jgi:DNA repair exonuclease SbcCD nuclease subunit